METLSKLFGSAVKVKVLKLFLFNADTPFDLHQISDRIKENSSKTRREISVLEKIKILKKRTFFKQITKKVRGKKEHRKVKTSGWVLNENFEYLIPLQTFMVTMNHLGPKDIVRKFSKAGNVKLIIISGVFIQEPESRVDILIVGDQMKKGLLESMIKNIEAEMGKEICYAIFETPDFQYRLGLYDKLVRDIMDSPHEKILNKLGI